MSLSIVLMATLLAMASSACKIDFQPTDVSLLILGLLIYMFFCCVIGHLLTVPSLCFYDEKMQKH